MNTFQNLKDFYNQKAQDFHHTRKKHWPEIDHIISSIKDKDKKNINILELGCGDGRLLNYLNDLDKNINYKGIDLSDKLLNIAKQKHPEHKFVNANMVNQLENIEQQRYDFIILIASFQHLPKLKDRKKVLQNIYKGLAYQGKCIMINWSFSKRFLKKYKKPILKSIGKSLISFGLHKINDLYIPWKGDDKTYQRYYHIFFLKELEKLFKYNSFIVQKSGYINGK